MTPGFLRTIYGYPEGTDFDFKKGDRIKKGALEVTVDRIDDDGNIRRIGVHIDRPLDDEDVWVMAWEGDRFVRRRFEPYVKRNLRRGPLSPR
jgi:hypothetical protein